MWKLIWSVVVVVVVVSVVSTCSVMLVLSVDQAASRSPLRVELEKMMAEW